MKKFLFAAAMLAAFAFMPTHDPLTEKEKQEAAKFLTETEEGVLNSVKGLSEAQLKFKPAADKWSVEETLKHIAVTEMGLWYMTDSVIKATPNPEKRADIKWTDEQVMTNIEDRTNKVKTFSPFEPQNTPYKSAEEAINAFKTDRGKLIAYIRATSDDLRSHVNILPFASFDCYQMILFIGAHSNRHMKQIDEIKADPNFPKQ